MLFLLQARDLICNRLALLLSFATITPPSDADGANKKSDSENHPQSDGVHVGPHTAEIGASNNQALTDILDLLETRISIDDEDRQKTEKNTTIKRGWMLAAAVIDRLCFIVLIIVFTVVTIVFVLLLILS